MIIDIDSYWKTFFDDCYMTASVFQTLYLKFKLKSAFKIISRQNVEIMFNNEI